MRHGLQLAGQHDPKGVGMSGTGSATHRAFCSRACSALPRAGGRRGTEAETELRADFHVISG